MLPRLFNIGSFALPTYGLLVAIGVIVGITVASKLAQREGINGDSAWNLGVFAILAAIVGAKLLMFINDWSWYSAHPGDIFTLSTLQAGGVFYGGLIAAIAISWWYIRREHLPVLRTCDAFAPGIALGHSIGRLGCFAAGCCYGKPTSHWWGVVFTNPLSQAPLNVRLEPTELFEAAIELINFFILYWLFQRKKFEGQIIGSYLFLYGVARFFLEFIRDDPDRGSMFHGALTGTQFISILLVIAGGVLWMRRSPAHAPLVRAAQKG